jgi:hypothetical protein
LKDFPRAGYQVLDELLQRNSGPIKERWLELTLASYRQDAAGFFMKQKDRFANPVGQTLATETGAIVDSLLARADATDLCLHLEEIVKIRAVQEFTPSEAVSFVFLLKDTVREVLADELSEGGLPSELVAFEGRIDQMALFAFDIFVKWREKVYSLRVREIKAGYVQPE